MVPLKGGKADVAILVVMPGLPLFPAGADAASEQAEQAYLKQVKECLVKALEEALK